MLCRPITKKMITTGKIRPQSPLGQLLQEKQEIRQQCQESENRIRENLQYIRSHAGRLLLSEIATIFMPGRKNREDKMGGRGSVHNPWLHLVWQIARPIAYRWMGEVGWQVFKSMFRKRRWDQGSGPKPFWDALPDHIEGCLSVYNILDSCFQVFPGLWGGHTIITRGGYHTLPEWLATNVNALLALDFCISGCARRITTLVFSFFPFLWHLIDWWTMLLWMWIQILHI